MRLKIGIWSMMAASCVFGQVLLDFSTHDLEAQTGLETGAGNFAIVPGGPDAPGDHCLEIASLGDGEAAGATVSFERSGRGVVAFQIRLGTRAWAQWYLRGTTYACRLEWRAGQPLAWLQGEARQELFADQPLEAGRWYSVQLFYDCAGSTADLIVDGRHGALDLPLSRETGYVDTMKVFLYERGLKRRLWIDGIAINSPDYLLVRPSLPIGPVNGLTLDGLGEEPGWQAAPPASGFHDLRQPSRPRPPPRAGWFRTGHDAEAWWFLFSVPDTGAATVLDSLELFAQPGRAGPVLQWLVPFGEAPRHYRDGKPWPENVATAASTRADGRLIWEIRIPWSTFALSGPPPPQEEWGVQVCFNDAPEKAITSWACMPGARYYRTPFLFARGYFLASPPAVATLDASGTGARASREELILNGEFDAGSNGVAAAGWTVGEGVRVEEMRQLSGNLGVFRDGPGLVASQAIGLAFPGNGEHRLKLRGVSREGAQPEFRLICTDAAGRPVTVTVAPEQPLRDGDFALHRTLRLPPAARSLDRVELWLIGGGQLGVGSASLSGAKVNLLVQDELSAMRPPPLQPVGDVPRTPALAWATPLAGAPPKVLFFLAGRGRDESGEYYNYAEERMPVEIAQRVGLDYDVIEPWEGRLLSTTAARVNQRLAANEYAVIVTSLPPSETGFWEALEEKVRQGAGLVATGGLPESLADGIEPIYGRTPPARQPHPLIDGLALEALPDPRPTGYLRSVAAGETGKGRVVSLGLGKDRGYWLYPPTRLTYDSYRQQTWPYWEVYYALMARAIAWAHRYAPVDQVEVTEAGGRLSIGWPQASPGTEVRWSHFDPHWRELGSDRVKGGSATFDFAPGAPAGTHYLLWQIVTGEGTANWGLIARPGSRSERIAEVTASPPHLEPGSQLTLTIGLEGLLEGEQYAMEAEVRDRHGRLLASNRRQVGDARLELTLQPVGVLGHELIVELALTSADLMKVARRRLYQPVRLDVREVLDDYVFNFLISVTSTSVFPHHVVPAIVSSLRDDLGINSFLCPGADGMAGLQIPLEGDFLTQFWGFRTRSSSRGLRYPLFGDNPKITGNTRRPCLDDPAVIADIDRAFRNFGEDMAIANPAMMAIEDEAALVLSNPTLDLCDCPHTLAAYRVWLRSRFPSLDAMNAAWGTRYATFDEPGLVTWQAARERANPAEFVVFREFMDHTFTARSAQVARVVRQTHPNCLVGYENTRAMRWYSGWDLEALAGELGFLGTYGTDMAPHAEPMPGYRHDREMVRSVAGSAKQMGWFGYGATHGEAHAYLPWYWALHGATGASLYYFGHPSHSYFLPDLRKTRSWAPIRDEMAPLLRGTGRLLGHLERTAPGIALFYSQASLAASWAQTASLDKNDGSTSGAQGAFLAGMEHARRLIEDSGRQWDFVTPRQIAAGALDRYRILFLPSTPVVDEATRSRLAAFVEAGGTVIAGPNSAWADGDGCPTDDAWLRTVFGIGRSPSRVPSYEPRPLDWDGTALTLVGGDAIALAGATVERHFGGDLPAATVHRVGRGQAIFLNFVLPAYDPKTSEFRALQTWLDEVCRRQGIAPWASLTRPDGSPVHGFELVQYTNGPVRLLGIIHDFRFPDATGELLLHLSAEAAIVDVRRGEPLATARVLPLTVAAGDIRLLALWPAGEVAAPTMEPTSGFPGARLTMTIRGPQVPVGVVRAELTDAAGKPCPHYAANVLLLDGEGAWEVPTALDDPIGRWEASLLDVASGRRASGVIELKAQ